MCCSNFHQIMYITNNMWMGALEHVFLVCCVHWWVTVFRFMVTYWDAWLFCSHQNGHSALILFWRLLNRHQGKLLLYHGWNMVWRAHCPCSGVSMHGFVPGAKCFILQLLCCKLLHWVLQWEKGSWLQVCVPVLYMPNRSIPTGKLSKHLEG